MTTPLDVAAWLPWLRDRSASVAPATEARVVTFPTTALVSRVQIALGADPSADPATWAWTDITSYVRFDPGITVSTGRRDEASQVSTGSATMRLDNRDGRFTRRNPNSPYYGLLSKNTPIWATVDAGSGEKTRLEMFVNEWPTRWSDKSATDSTVTIRCAGILRRLAQGQVLKEPLRRAILADVPGAYWPLEDGFDSQSGGSAVATSPGPMTLLSGSVEWAGLAGPAGASSLPDFTPGGSVGADIPGSAFASSSAWTVELIINAASAATTLVPIRIFTAGSFQRFYMQITVGFVSLNGYLNDGTFVPIVLGIGTVFNDEWHHLRVTAQQGGADISFNVYLDGVLCGAGTASSATLGKVIRVDLNSDLSTSANGIGHVAVFGSVVGDHSEAIDGFAGEMAHERLVRLTNEEGVLFATGASSSAAMGAQGSGTLLDLLHQAEAADGGVLYEKRWGLAYKSRTECYNQPVGLALDIDQGHLADIPEPADDDQRTRNRWTVSRTDGSEATFDQTTGVMGTGSQGPGIYDDSVTLNVETDAQLQDQASWRVHLGTVDENRWPDLALNFAHDPSLVNTWCALAYGARTSIANPLPQMPPDPPDLIIEGYSEHWNSKQWSAFLNCSPASPYQVAVVEDSTSIQDVPRVGSATATLAVGISSSDVSLSVTTGAGGLWTTLAADFPLDINVGGERIRLSAISGAASPQTFTVSARSINTITKSHQAGASVEVWRVATVGL